VTFKTDDANGDWLDAMDEETKLGVSLIVHRIVTQARESARVPSDGERRASDRRSA
jgi:hypothetical protein